MSDRKKSGKNFHNPFKQLKGLSVSPSPKSKPSRREEDSIEPLPAKDEDALFEQEMARLGVASRQEAEGEIDAVEDRSQEAPPSAPVTDRDLFLDALGEMEVTFRDHVPSVEEPQAAARRMKQLRRGRLVPEATLDLHGLTRQEARSKVAYFLEDSIYQGRKTVLIVTGRGKGSEGEPVLRTEIERYLAQKSGTTVSEWSRAPRRYGGEGALVVFLKPAEK